MEEDGFGTPTRYKTMTIIMLLFVGVFLSILLKSWILFAACFVGLIGTLFFITDQNFI